MITRRRGGTEAQSSETMGFPAGPAPIGAVLTPAGRGAIATVAVAGEGAVRIVNDLFKAASGKPLTDYPPGSVVFGAFQALEAKAEELVVGLPRADYVEVHCHGGTAAVNAICEALVAAGARLVESASFVGNMERNMLRAAALVALAEAKTTRTAAILLDQYRGALSAAIHELERNLAAGDLASAVAQAERLLSWADLGLHLAQPWRIVLAGAPNAGKSSLMNAILGFERSIVYAEPGTTRDVLSALTAIDGWPVELLDTAGLRETDEALEAAGAERTRRELLRADLVLFVADGAAAWDDALFQAVQRQASRAPHHRLPLVVVAHNKADLVARPPDDRPQGHLISANTGLGIEQLCRTISQTLVPQTPPPGTAVPFNEEQIHGLKEVLACLKRGEWHAAAATTAALVGNPLDRA